MKKTLRLIFGLIAAIATGICLDNVPDSFYLLIGNIFTYCMVGFSLAYAISSDKTNNNK